MISLGFSVGHDKGAVLIIDGEVKVGISQERLSRVKHDGFAPGIPFESIDYCLNEWGLSYADVDLYVYNFTEDYKETSDFLEEEFVNRTGLSLEKLVYIPHHLAHACSSFYSSGFEDAAVIVVDAMGSVFNNKTAQWYDNSMELQKFAEGHTIFHFSGNTYKEEYKKWVSYPLHDTCHSHYNLGTSLGYFYGIGTRQLVYNKETNSWAAGKLMGLASYAQEEWLNSQKDLIEFEGEHTFKVLGSTYHPHVNSESSFQERANVAGLYQRSLEKGIMALAAWAKKYINTENLCVAGGCFLNCNSNELLVKSGLFKDYFFLPPADDSGIPLGCAWYGQMQYVQKPNRMKDAFFGKKYTEQDVLDAVERYQNEEGCKLVVEKFDLENVVDMLVANKVIGYFNGGSEIGPRALGHRSILASPIEPWMQNYINSEIKKREWYRPFAPSVLEEYAKDVFELDFYSPFMLVTSKVKEEWIDRIPAVVHIDKTSRFQCVSKDIDEKYHNLISKFYEKTGVPLLLNTSFNGNEEPIVESPYDAIKSFCKNKLDALSIENFLIRLS
jgi:carbamoyltransferase